MTAEEIKKEFDENMEKAIAGGEFSRGAVVGVLKKACRSDGDYRLVLKALTGKTSSKELSESAFYALYLFVLPHKPENGKWQSFHGDDVLEKRCSALVNAMIAQEGQMRFA